MAKYTNFYETVKEAEMRLKHTVVLYEGEPYVVLCVTNHKGDGIFRIYLDAINQKGGPAMRRVPGIPYDWFDEPGMSKGQAMDNWMDQHTGEVGVIRKMMNSPSFNGFRPFPLGMVNKDGKVYYTERSPTRSTYQGLNQNMVTVSPVSLVPDANRPRIGGGVSIFDGAFGQMVVGNYPSAAECLKGLSDPRIRNESAAFHRNFALFRGPLDMMFLAYKGDVVGVMPDGNFSRVDIAKEFRHCKEAVAELSVFNTINIRG